MQTNELTMLPVEWLEHHPDNPRKDLSDLKELTSASGKTIGGAT